MLHIEVHTVLSVARAFSGLDYSYYYCITVLYCEAAKSGCTD